MNKINTINGVLMASQDELNEHVENGTAHVTEEERTVWNTQASVNAKGIVIATQGDLDEHTANKAIHLTEEERTAWNAKADTSDLVSKVDVETFNAHKGDDAVHITEKDRNSWNGKQDKLTDDEGNMTLAGGLTAAAAINANGGVRVPTPTTVHEAISYEAMVEQQALQNWKLMINNIDTQIPSWVTTLVRQMQMGAYSVRTDNATMREGVYDDSLQDFLVTITPASGISLTGLSTSAWKFAQYLGSNNNASYAVASVWRITENDNVSILLGSTSHGYASSTSPAADCYAHPIHWADYGKGVDYRYPLEHEINGLNHHQQEPAWQMTIYPKEYLGSETSCLVRGTHYGPSSSESYYVWALVPRIKYVAVAITPRHVDVDGRNVYNRWPLFIDGKYVMPMTSLFLGAGNTACITVKVKAHEVRSTCRVGLRMGGMRIDANRSLGVTNAYNLMERIVMRDAIVKPVPEVESSVLEVPAEGGEVTLSVSSTLAEAMYVINDTMCGHDPSAVWCSQSSEQIPAEGGNVTLRLAANTTGEPRQVWAYIGHHYAQAAVVKIKQLA